MGKRVIRELIRQELLLNDKEIENFLSRQWKYNLYDKFTSHKMFNDIKSGYLSSHNYKNNNFIIYSYEKEEWIINCTKGQVENDKLIKEILGYWGDEDVENIINKQTN